MSTWRENVLGMMELVEAQLTAASRLHGFLRLEVERVIQPPAVKEKVAEAPENAPGEQISTVRYISIPTAASISGHSQTTLYKAIREGDLKGIRVAGRMGVTPAELTRFMRSPSRPRRLSRSR